MVDNLRGLNEAGIKELFAGYDGKYKIKYYLETRIFRSSLTINI